MSARRNIPGTLDLDAMAALYGGAPPNGICANCFRTWRAAKPQPKFVYCHHNRAAAKPMLGGWVTVEDVDRHEILAAQRLLEERKDAGA
jgi:hypothetical protein